MFDNRSDSKNRVYPKKDSMLRFGDDLTEEVLQYLTFKDKIRLECVSKQWQRCVFNKQHGLYPTFRPTDKFLTNKVDLNLQILESLLKKCPNITKVNLSYNVKNTTEVLSLIARYCNRIKSLTYFPDFGKEDEKSLSFFRMYGHKLEELRLKDYSTEFQQISKFCPNVKKVLLSINLFEYPENEEFLPKVEEILNKLEINRENMNILKILSDKYSQTMKTLNVWLWCLTAEELKTCIECIARFEKLQSLTISFE